ncbi:hypothetical protein [Rhodococcus rhodochrous]|uniref:hypothetical protein n=1 Tax=Rhodococcus rhodochrous TaxID=1829 RepID=UPI001352097C|nr:hypothetical protein [Rhodococcus rhodochrous]
MTYENIRDRHVYRGKHVLFRKLPLATNLCCFSDTNQFPRREWQKGGGGEGANAHSAQRIPPQEGTPSHPTTPMTKTEKRYACWVALAPIPFMHARSLHMKSPI